MSLKEIEINTGNWGDSVQDRDYCRALANAELNLRVPYAMELALQYSDLVNDQTVQRRRK